MLFRFILLLTLPSAFPSFKLTESGITRYFSNSRIRLDQEVYDGLKARGVSNKTLEEFVRQAEYLREAFEKVLSENEMEKFNEDKMANWIKFMNDMPAEDMEIYQVFNEERNDNYTQEQYKEMGLSQEAIDILTSLELNFTSGIEVNGSDTDELSRYMNGFPQEEFLNKLPEKDREIKSISRKMVRFMFERKEVFDSEDLVSDRLKAKGMSEGSFEGLMKLHKERDQELAKHIGDEVATEKCLMEFEKKINAFMDSMPKSDFAIYLEFMKNGMN